MYAYMNFNPLIRSGISKFQDLMNAPRMQYHSAVNCGGLVYVHMFQIVSGEPKES